MPELYFNAVTQSKNAKVIQAPDNDKNLSSLKFKVFTRSYLLLNITDPCIIKVTQHFMKTAVNIPVYNKDLSTINAVLPHMNPPKILADIPNRLNLDSFILLNI